MPLLAKFDLEVGIHSSCFHFILFFPGRCVGEEQEQVSVGAGRVQWLVLGGADGETTASSHDVCAQTPALAHGRRRAGGLVGSRVVS